jgi:hypothetical protein
MVTTTKWFVTNRSILTFNRASSSGPFPWRLVTLLPLPNDTNRHRVNGHVSSSKSSYSGSNHDPQVAPQSVGTCLQCQHCPSFVSNSLFSTVKMVKAGYMTVFDDKEFNFYNTMTTKITVLAGTILKGWHCPWAKLWCVPLVDNVQNENTDTLLLDHPHKHDCLNSLYELESTTTTWQHINTIMLQTINQEYFHNVYKSPSIKPTIRYLHAAAGFPMEETWLKAI